MVEGVVFCGLSIFLLSFSRDSWLYVISGFFLLSFSSFMGMWSWSAMWKGVISWGGIDGLSSGLLSLTFWLGAMMMLASYSSYSSSGTTSFCCMISLLTFILLLCFCFTNFFMFYIVFELSLVPTLMLILGWGYQPERLQAGSYMMMYTISASLPFLVCLLYWSVTFGGVSFFLINSFSLKDLWFLSFLGFWFVLAFLVKLPMYFVHLWLPKAHVEAPVAGSMILAGILLKLGGYGLMRIVTLVGEGVYSLLEFLGILSIWGGILTSLVCLRQSDVKALIAYSSVAHMGLMLGGLMTFSVNGWQGGLMMMLAHGMASSGLFALAGLQYEFFSSRSVVLNKGLLCVFPFMALWWFLLSACNMASPPSMNLVSELLLIMSMLMYSSYLSSFIFLLGVLAGAYSIYLYVSVNHGKYSNFVHPLVGNSMGRIGVMFLCHWVPLNILILKVDVLLF